MRPAVVASHSSQISSGCVSELLILSWLRGDGNKFAQVAAQFPSCRVGPRTGSPLSALNRLYMQEPDKRPLILWAPFPAISLWRIDMEHKPWRRGFNAPLMSQYVAQQERTVLKWGNTAAKGGPFELLDMLAITKQCGDVCTVDGLHPSGSANLGVVQVLANIVAAKRPRDAVASDEQCAHDARYGDTVRQLRRAKAERARAEEAAAALAASDARSAADADTRNGSMPVSVEEVFGPAAAAPKQSATGAMSPHAVTIDPNISEQRSELPSVQSASHGPAVSTAAERRQPPPQLPMPPSSDARKKARQKAKRDKAGVSTDTSTRGNAASVKQAHGAASTAPASEPLQAGTKL